MSKKLTRSVNFLNAGIALAGFGVALYLFYPGCVSPDSMSQYEQATNGYFKDWHPPMMAAIWGAIDLIIPGPLGMLLLHLTALWSGLFLVARQFAERNVWLSIFVVMTGMMPSVIGMEGVIWKDISLGSTWTLAVGLIMAAAKAKHHRIVMLSAAFLLIFYGSLTRHNAFPAAVPLYLMWSTVSMPFIGLRTSTTRVVVLSLVLSSVMYGVYRALETNALRPRQEHIEQVIWLDDLAFFSHETRQDLVPVTMRSKSYSPERLAKALSNVRAADPLIFNQDSPFALTRDVVVLADLRKIWLQEVASHPSLWWFHRMDRFGSLMGIGCRSTYLNHIFSGWTAGPFAWHETPARLWMKTAIEETGYDLPTSKGWFLLLVVSMVSLFAIFTHRIVASQFLFHLLCIALSGLLLGLSYLFTTISSDFRYLWWMAITAHVSMGTLFYCVQVIWSKNHVVE